MPPAGLLLPHYVCDHGTAPGAAACGQRPCRNRVGGGWCDPHPVDAGGPAKRSPGDVSIPGSPRRLSVYLRYNNPALRRTTTDARGSFVHVNGITVPRLAGAGVASGQRGHRSNQARACSGPQARRGPAADIPGQGRQIARYGARHDIRGEPSALSGLRPVPGAGSDGTQPP